MINITRNLIVLISIFSYVSATSIAQDACQYFVNKTVVYNLIDFANVP